MGPAPCHGPIAAEVAPAALLRIRTSSELRGQQLPGNVFSNNASQGVCWNARFPLNMSKAMVFPGVR